MGRTGNAAALACVAVLAAGAVAWLGFGREAAGSRVAPGAAERATPRSAAPVGPPAAPPPAPVAGRAPVSSQALPSGDGPVSPPVDMRRAREEELRAGLAADPDQLARLLERFRTAEDPLDIASLGDVLASDGRACASPEAIAAMLAIAEDPAAGAPRREHALLFLMHATKLDPAQAERLRAIAASDDPVLRRGALAALASIVNATPDCRAAALPALLAALPSEPEAEVRAGFMATVTIEDSVAAANEVMAGALEDESSAIVRAAAAHALGSAAGPARESAVRALGARFERETDLAARRAILASLVRLEGGNARATLVALLPRAGSAAADVEDYLAIIASGETQADRIYRLKFQREIMRGQLPPCDHHNGAEGDHPH